ncbi:MAG: DUF1254 domain-containing protein [Bacteroidales bacterium]|nr:DUF1254 domain-containing protein [Bacteroidales bacterium]
MKTKTLITSLTILIVVAFTSCNQQPEITPEEAKEIAKEAYIYGFPLVVNYKTMYMYAVDENSPEYKGPFNESSCDARLFTPEDKAVVTPNSDTPYCMFWVDLRDEPQVISLPEIEAERFYHFQLIDLYTHNFAYLGTLTTGNKAGKYLIANQGWEGEKPEGVDEVIYCETDLFFVVVRTQLMNENDLENVKNIQDDYQLQALSSYLDKDMPKVVRMDNFPDWNEGDQFTAAAFNYLDVMLKLAKPVTSEKELRSKFTKLGIGTEKGFDISSFDEETQKAIEEGIKEGFQEIETFIKEYSADPLVSAKIFGTRDFLTQSAKENYKLDDFYIPRAVAAHLGLYGNSGAEAIYPGYFVDSTGVPLNALENKYSMTFKKDELPPVKAFWSLSMYDGKTQLFINNQLDRYLLNSNNMEAYDYNDDGSLTLYIQIESPGKELEPNWLPAPDGPFYCVMRLYGPKQEALLGEWVNPPMVKNNQNN